MANVEPPVAIYRSATTIGAVTIETLAFERSELLVAGANEPEDTLALEWGEVGEAFAHDPPETLTLERGELGVAFVHHTCAVHQSRQLSDVQRTCRSNGRHSRFW